MSEEVLSIADDEEVGGIADVEQAADVAESIAETEEAKEVVKELEAYTLDAIDGFPLTDDQRNGFAEKCRSAGINAEQAKTLMEYLGADYAALQEQSNVQRKEMLDGWRKEILEDKEFGGAHWKQTVTDARKALSQFDTDGTLRTLMKETGFDNNPAVIRVVARIGRALGEHSFIGNNGKGGAAQIPLEERLYKNMKI